MCIYKCICIKKIRTIEVNNYETDEPILSREVYAFTHGATPKSSIP